MSHFTVLVIGENPEEQLEPFNENERVEEYSLGVISEEDRLRFIEYYIKEHPEDAELDFDSLYKKYGESWNGNEWRKTKNGWEAFSSYNPDSKWDWYVLGGRWRSFFKLKKRQLLPPNTVLFNKLGFSQGEVENLLNMYENDKDKFDKVRAKYNGKSEKILEMVKEELEWRKSQYPPHVVGESGAFGNAAIEGYADQVLKKYIDFEGMRKEAADEAGKKYDEAISIFGDLPPNEEWDALRERYSAEGKTVDDARKDYWDQPRCKVWRNSDKSHPFGPSPDDFLISREEYTTRAANNAISTYAVLNHGKWYAKGEMGWFGMSNDKTSQEQWNAEFNKLINELPDDMLLSVYDCHI